MRWQRVLGALVPVVLVAMLAACTGTGSSPVTALSPKAANPAES